MKLITRILALCLAALLLLPCLPGRAEATDLKTGIGTVTASALILSERVTAMAALGTCLILAGLAISESEGWGGQKLMFISS